MQVSILHVAIGPVYAVLRRAMIRHIVCLFEPECLGSGGAGNAHLLDDRLVLPPRNNLKSIKASTSERRVGLGMKRILQSTYILYAAAAALTPAAMRQVGRFWTFTSAP